LKKASIFLDEIVEDSLKQRGFIYHTLFNRWTEIVGDELSAVTTPARLKFSRRYDGAILTIRINSALVPQIQLQVENIIERINYFYGKITVKNIKLEGSNELSLLRSSKEVILEENSENDKVAKKYPLDEMPEIQVKIADPELQSILQTLKRNWIEKNKNAINETD
tara:strand:+ start:489 stop:986 length:498 start_codon:yes stop_codon:yes gene_type:complete